MGEFSDRLSLNMRAKLFLFMHVASEDPPDEPLSCRPGFPKNIDFFSWRLRDRGPEISSQVTSCVRYVTYDGSRRDRLVWPTSLEENNRSFRAKPYIMRMRHRDVCGKQVEMMFFFLL